MKDKSFSMWLFYIKAIQKCDINVLYCDMYYYLDMK